MKSFFFLFFLVLFSTVGFSAPYYLAGDFQGWSNNTTLMYDDGTGGDAVAGDGIYSVSYTVGVTGYHGFKITNGTWDNTSPANNAWFYTVTPNQIVLFTFNTNTVGDGWLPSTKIIITNEAKITSLVAVGNWQKAVGETGDWINNSTKTAMYDNGLDGDFAAGDGIFTFHISTLPAGSYMIKAVESGTWHAYGTDGPSEDAANLNFTTTEANQNVYFYVNTNTSRVKLVLNNPMPVELTSFEASVSGKQVLLNWKTATEINNFGFEIQRSMANSNNWSKIGFINGAGNSTVKKEYSFTDREPLLGKTLYRLKQIDIDGTSEYSSIVEVDNNVPNHFNLDQNYPNPFNPATMISYEVAKNSNVTLKIYDVLGKIVTTLVNQFKPAGRYSVEFNAGNFPSGIYFYELNADGVHLVKKMNLLK